MFYGLSSGKVKLEGITIRHQLEDIQTLNERALNGELEVTAISAHAYAFVADKYWVMRTGASMGERYGPVIVSKRYRSLDDLHGKTVATPGKLTTATLLFKIFTEGIQHVDVPFDQIMDRVSSGEFDAGLLIHEGQLTYGREGFTKVLDFGELWDSMYNLPLPLGLDVVRKDLGEETARSLSLGLRQSIHYGYTHQKEAVPYSLQYGRGIDMQLGEKFVKMYVNELTIDMGERGRNALGLLYKLGVDRNAIPVVADLQLL
jgi:1,4-dihydroxy-6-naphthoate synthase